MESVDKRHYNVVSVKMKNTYNFDPEKNKKLIEIRGISFEEVVTEFETEGALDVMIITMIIVFSSKNIRSGNKKLNVTI